MLVADVAGHGEQAADLAGKLRDLMRRYVNHVDSRRFMERMNREFARLSSGGRFATAIVAEYFAPKRRLTICNAGHPPPMLYRAADRSWHLLDADEPGGAKVRNLPIGIIEEQGYEQIELTLDVGDVVVCFSDSLPEARTGDGEMLGSAGLMREAEAVGEVTAPDEFARRWLSRLHDACGGSLAHDDLTLLCFRVTPGPSIAPFFSRLCAAFKMLAQPLLGRPMPWPELTRELALGAIRPCRRSEK
jgi:serine phosphatase RsbU (regulator of sigma subunit)